VRLAVRVRRRWACVVVVLAAPLPAARAEVAVTLRIAEPAGVARRGAPATTGVPLPRGAVRDAAGLGVSDAHGEAVASQTTVLERWPDGSVRWVLVDALADVAADGEVAHVLRQGAPRPSAGPRLRLEQTPMGTVIDTGPLRVTVPANGDALASAVDLGGQRAAGPIPLPALAVERANDGAPTPEPPRVETEGPVRAEVLLRGRWPDGATYEARLAAFAGQPVLRLRYTLTNMGDAPILAVRRLGVSAPGAFRSGAFGIAGDVRRFAPLSAPHVLRQADTGDAQLDRASAGARADCWVAGAGAQGTTLLVAPHCWQQYPLELGISKGALRVDLLAGGDEPLALGRGAAKTHDVWFAFQPPAGGSPPRELAASLAAPLVAHVDPRWVVHTGALAQSLAPEDAGAGPFLRRLAEAFRRYEVRGAAERWDDGSPGDCAVGTSEHVRTGFFGALNWGDWNFPGYHDRTKGCDAWGNLEYDLTQVLGLGWVATGKRPMWDAFVAAARHYRDVDIIHHDPQHPDRVGLNHPHKVGHFAAEAGQNVDLGHAWLEGLITHYRLTGERRSLEAARAMGDALAGRVGKAANPRQFGWPMIALAALAEATGDARYRDAATRFADPALRAYEPTPAAGDWKVGILADGLAAVQAVAPDGDRRTWLERYADALVTAPPDRFPDARYALPLGVLAVWTGDPRYRERALAVAENLEVGDWGKTLALGGRTGFRLLGPLAAQQESRTVTPGPAAPPRPSAGARRRR
jgi:PcRGLX-like N-terminal RIFT barrel domain/Beta-L-arabinofuranosidase, GH127 catalytic domain